MECKLGSTTESKPRRQARILKLNLKVRAAPISGNIDNPEGGLDALMQAREREKDLNMWADQVMVCGERVGWREEARRVIIYTTDQVPVTAKPTSC